MNSQANQKWTPLELTGLVEDDDSHVCFTRTTKHLALHPYYLNDVCKALNNILGSSRNTYDRELEGFVLDFKKPKILSNLGLTLYDSPFIHINIEADFYLFRPTVGCILKGIVNKKGADHVIMLVHKMFTVSIPKPYDVEEWPGDSVEVGQQIRCHLTEINKWSEPPFICGTLKSDYLEGCRLPESVIDSGKSVILNNSEESADRTSFVSPKSNTNLNGHIQKKSRKASINIRTDSLSKIIDGENTISDVNNISFKEKKKITKKHIKSRDSDSECAFTIKEEKSKNMNNVNNTTDEGKRMNPKKRVRISSESDAEFKNRIKKEKSTIVKNSPTKEIEINPKKRIKICKDTESSDTESPSKIAIKKDVVDINNASDQEKKKISKKHIKSRDSDLEFTFRIKKEKDVSDDNTSNKEREMSPKKYARRSNDSDAEFKFKIKKEKDTSVKNSPIKELEKSSKKHIKTSKDSNTESTFKVNSTEDIFSDASISGKRKKSSKKRIKSRDSDVESTFRIKKEDISDINNSSDEGRKKYPKEHTRIAANSDAEPEIKIKKEKLL